MAIILCDLDELKYINDNFGHKMGDVLIQEIARILNKFTSDNIIVARIGGDEFVLIVAEKTKEEIEQLMNDISIEINKHNESVNNIKIKISVGYAYTLSSIGQMTELFSQADKVYVYG